MGQSKKDEEQRKKRSENKDWKRSVSEGGGPWGGQANIQSLKER